MCGAGFGPSPEEYRLLRVFPRLCTTVRSNFHARPLFAAITASYLAVGITVARHRNVDNFATEHYDTAVHPTKEDSMPDKDTKAMTVRLSTDQHADLEAIAQVDEVPVAEAVRDAIEAHIKAKRADKEFRARLRQRLEEHREVLERLAS